MRARLFFRMSLLGFILATLCVSAWGGRPSDTEPTRIDRLVALCKLWGTVKYFHPHLAYREDIDWDRALVDAIPKVNAAKNRANYAEAVQGMLNALGDPTSRVLRTSLVGPPSRGERHPLSRWTDDKVLVVAINNYTDLWDEEGSADKLTKIAAEIPNARGVLFDLRTLRLR